MLTMKDIIREGHETLYKQTLDVNIPIQKEDSSTLFSMMEYIVNSQDEELSKKYSLRPSVGLAAPQINISKSMIAIHTTDETGEVLYSYMLVNPKIISHSEEMTYLNSGEGCLSIDREVPGYVLRYKRITVKGYQLKTNGQLEEVTLRFKGYVSVVLQHEIDHLNGILFPDRINKPNPFLVDSNIKPIEFK